MAALRVLTGAAALVTALASPGYAHYSDFGGAPFTVTYDNRSIFLNGQRTIFASAGVHYPRFTQGQWDDIFLKLKNDGYNMIQTYVFVNAHQPKMQWPWIMEGPADLRTFIQKAAENDFFVTLRIGPYVCAEWSYGGYPYNLALTPDLVSRSSSPAWEAWMSAVVINVTQVLFRDLFADKGGPIVIAQVENELHTSDQAYIDYCGQLAEQALDTVPWVMCNGNSASNTINSCNSGDCTGFIENNGQNGQVLISQPALWTENWMGWFASWGDGSPAGGWPNYNAMGQSSGKSAGILRWFARGGSHINFYNVAGGNHFARNAGSSMVNLYYWDAPYASDNLPQGPERQHMARTYAALQAAAATLLANPAQLHQQVTPPYYAGGTYYPSGDSKHIAFVYEPDVAFLENTGATATYVWKGMNFTVPGGSISLVRADGTVLINSNDVWPTGTQRAWAPLTGALGAWQAWADPTVPTSPSGIPAPTAPRAPWSGSALGAVIASGVPLEAVNFTEYDSELAFYVTTVTLPAGGGDALSLAIVSSKAQAWTIFINGALVGTGWELSHSGGAATITCALNVSGVPTGTPVVLTMMSTSLGIDNGVSIRNDGTTFYSSGWKGVTSQAAGAVKLGSADITSNGWTHIVGATGEARAVYTPAGGALVPWAPVPAPSLPALTWLRVNFTAPPSVLAPPVGTELNASLNLDVSGLGRGRFWVNGFDLGRYWSKACGGDMCQRFYSIPFDLLLPGAGANSLVILDETGISNVSAVALTVGGNYPPPPPTPCGAVPTGGAAAVMTPCGSNGTVWSAMPVSGGAVSLSLASTAGLCLGVTSSNGPSGSPQVGLAPCNGSDARQAWLLPVTPMESMSSLAFGSGTCLDIGAQNSSVGANLDMWSCNGGSNQQWAWNATAGTLMSGLNNLCAGYC